MSNKYIFIIFVLTNLCGFENAYTQSSITFSTQGGLVRTDDNYGRALSASSRILVSRTSGAELGYTNLEIESGLNDTYNTHRYSLLGTQLLYSNDSLFFFTMKIGPSLLSYSGPENENTVLGMDIGMETAFKLFGSLYLNFGLVGTLNKNTDMLIHLYTGFSYKFSFSEKD